MIHGRTVKIFLAIAAIVVFVADFLVPREHTVFIWDKIPGWSAVYGFVSAFLIIIGARVVGYGWLMKREDYYD